MEPPAAETARILEIGCASGGNIIPLAESFPNAKLVGIDASGNQIAEGNRILNSIGVNNLELRAMDMCEVDQSLENSTTSSHMAFTHGFRIVFKTICYASALRISAIKALRT